jgi:hypothetical protein
LSGGLALPGGGYDPRVAQALVIVLYCLVAAMYNALETVSTPLTVRQFGWGVRENAFLWTGSGLVGTLASLFVGHLPPDHARPADLLAASLCATIAGPLLMLLSLRSHASPNNAGAPLALLTALASERLSGRGKGRKGDRGASVLPHLASSGAHMDPLFLCGFFVFDVGYVITESVLVVLFAAAVDPTVAADEVEEEGEHAFLFGIFNSIGWFLGCAIGAIAGNYFFLISPATMLTACSVTAVSVAVSLVASRRRVFPENDTGCLMKDPAAVAAWLGAYLARLHRRALDTASGGWSLGAAHAAAWCLSSSSSSSSSSAASASAASSSAAACKGPGSAPGLAAGLASGGAASAV